LGKDSIGAYAEWLISFLDALGLRQTIVTGHSMGGAIALEAALRCPARVAGLGLIATGARLPVAPNLLAGLQQDPEAAIDTICRWAFGPETPSEMLHLAATQMRSTPPEFVHHDFEACNAFDVGERLAGIACPTLVLCGSQDRMTPPKYSRFLKDRIQGSTLEIVEGAGHMVMLERPRAVLSALSSLLAKPD
jgi:pimeloyl-ACP methyl ester carboxylesterase